MTEKCSLVFFCLYWWQVISCSSYILTPPSLQSYRQFKHIKNRLSVCICNSQLYNSQPHREQGHQEFGEGGIWRCLLLHPGIWDRSSYKWDHCDLSNSLQMFLNTQLHIMASRIQISQWLSSRYHFLQRNYCRFSQQPQVHPCTLSAPRFGFPHSVSRPDLFQAVDFFFFPTTGKSDFIPSL